MYPYIEDELNKKEVLDELSNIKRGALKKYKDRKSIFQIHLFDLEKICKSINVSGKIFSFKYSFSIDRKLGNVGTIDNYCRVQLSIKARPSTLVNIDKNFDKVVNSVQRRKDPKINKTNICYFADSCLIIRPQTKKSTKTLTFMKMYDIFRDFQDYGSIMLIPQRNPDKYITVLVDNMVYYVKENKNWRVST